MNVWSIQLDAGIAVTYQAHGVKGYRADGIIRCINDEISAAAPQQSDNNPTCSWTSEGPQATKWPSMARSSQQPLAKAGGNNQCPLVCRWADWKKADDGRRCRLTQIQAPLESTDRRSVYFVLPSSSSWYIEVQVHTQFHQLPVITSSTNSLHSTFNSPQYTALISIITIDSCHSPVF